MKKLLLLVLVCFLPAASAGSQPHWQKAQAERLVEWLDAAADDGLVPVSKEAPVNERQLIETRFQGLNGRFVGDGCLDKVGPWL